MSSSAPAEYRFPQEMIAVAVHWYLRYGLSYRDIEELLAERGIEIDHVTVYRWVQTSLRSSSTPPARHGTRRAIAGSWIRPTPRSPTAGPIPYRGIDQHGQIIDVLVSTRRDATAAREFFARALRLGPSPVAVTTDRAPVYPRIVEELEPPAHHVTEQYANNPVEADHGRLKSRLRPMRGLKRLASARTMSAGHALAHNLRRGQHQLTTDLPMHDRVRFTFNELTIRL